jgi:hypothetical protein
VAVGDAVSVGEVVGMGTAVGTISGSWQPIKPKTVIHTKRIRSLKTIAAHSKPEPSQLHNFSLPTYHFSLSSDKSGTK